MMIKQHIKELHPCKIGL